MLAIAAIKRLLTSISQGLLLTDKALLPLLRIEFRSMIRYREKGVFVSWHTSYICLTQVLEQRFEAIDQRN